MREEEEGYAELEVVLGVVESLERGRREGSRRFGELWQLAPGEPEELGRSDLRLYSQQPFYQSTDSLEENGNYIVGIARRYGCSSGKELSRTAVMRGYQKKMATRNGKMGG